MKQLVLVGGGHAHVHVLAALAAQPLADTEVTLVSPYARQIYSGMLPGWISGYYAIEECALALDRLARRAGVRLVQTACSGLALDAGQVLCANGEHMGFDILSIDSGPVAGSPDLAGGEGGMPIRPIEGFIAAWPALLERARRPQFRLAIVGDGAAAVELAFAIATRFADEELAGAGVTLIGGNQQPLAGFPSFLRKRVTALLAQRGIAWHGDRRATAIGVDHVQTGDGTRLPADAVLLATGAAAPAWPAAGGLACDNAGYIAVSPMLQSLSHPRVFAAGDVAALHYSRPKSGVFAVRAGPPLAHNLRAICSGKAMTPWRPQHRALYLISTGQRHALAAWGRLSTEGDWVWRWKDRIDRRFIARFGG